MDISGRPRPNLVFPVSHGDVFCSCKIFSMHTVSRWSSKCCRRSYCVWGVHRYELDNWYWILCVRAVPRWAICSLFCWWGYHGACVSLVLRWNF